MRSRRPTPWRSIKARSATPEWSRTEFQSGEDDMALGNTKTVGAVGTDLGFVRFVVDSGCDGFRKGTKLEIIFEGKLLIRYYYEAYKPQFITGLARSWASELAAGDDQCPAQRQ